MKLGGWLKSWRGKGGGKVPVAAPTLTSPHRIPYGAFQFRITATPGCLCELQASGDLHNWVTTAKFPAPGADFEHVDSEASKFGHRFYRVLADGVPSSNVIGYATTSLPPSFAMIANPFLAADNAVGTLFRDWPEGTTLNKFDTSLFRLTENAVKNRQWTNPRDPFVPGEGAIFFNPTPDYRPLTFAGNVVLGNVSIPIPAGFSIRSSPIPQFGPLLEELAFPIADGDVVHLFDREKKKYLLHPYENGRWTHGTPVVAIGESFWIAKKTAANWVRNFTPGL